MRLLVVEDEPELNRLLKKRLEEAHYSVDACLTGTDALDYLAGAEYDALVLDVMLPGVSGLEVLRRMRSARDATPVLLLTARDGIEDRVTGLDAGADDYLPKPFDTAVLRARLRALLRRSGGGTVLQAGDLRLDPAELTLTGPAGAAELSRKECALLEALLRAPGRLQPRAALLARVWGPLAEVEDANLDCYIHFVRRRLRAVGSAARVVTVRGSGYRLEVPPC